MCKEDRPKALLTLIPDYIDEDYVDESYFARALNCDDLWKQDYMMARIFATPSYANLLVSDLHRDLETKELKVKNEDTLKDIIRHKEEVFDYSDELEELTDFIMSCPSEGTKIQYMIVCHTSGVIERIRHSGFLKLVEENNDKLSQVKAFTQKELINAGFYPSPKLCVLAKEDLIQWLMIYFDIGSLDDYNDLKQKETKNVNFINRLGL